MKKPDFKTDLRKTVCLMIMLAVLFSLSWMVSPSPAGADPFHTSDPATELSINVGYYGGPYYLKKVYTLSDLEAMPSVEQAYTFIDNMPAVVVDAGKGVKLADILIDAGIDLNSVQILHFWATDIKKQWYQSLPKEYLLDTTRYYYPALPTHWDYDNQVSIPGAVYGAIEVPTIMAYHDNWKRFVTEPDFSVKDTSTRYRLLLGQTDTATHTASRSVKWVHAIDVELGGAPPAGVTLDRNLADIKVGSTFQLTPTVSPNDATEKSVTWSSSDPQVAIVDKNGLVTVIGPGTATITVSTLVGDLTATCLVNGSNSVSSSVQEAAPPAGSSESEKDEEPDTSTQAQSPETDRSYLVEREVAANVSEAAEVSSRPVSQPWRVFEMSADAVPLQMQKIPNSLSIYAAIMFVALFMGGAGRKYMEFVREVAR